MKNKLLLTTALVAAFSANNTFAAPTLPDLNVDDKQELTESTGVSYNTINVTKGGELTLNGANIKTSAKDTPNNDIIVNGTLNLNNESVLEAGSDIDYLPNNSNIFLNEARVNMDNSDLEANGNILIKNTDLSISSSTAAPDNHGIWADGNLTLEGGASNLTNSYLSADGDITINQGNIKSQNSTISANNNININGGTINMDNSTNAYTQPLNDGEGIFGGNISIAGAKQVNISDGEINLNQTSINGWEGVEVSGGTLNLNSSENSMYSTLWSKGNIILSGGTINTNNAAINTFYSKDGVDSQGDIIISGATLNIAADSNLNLGSKGEIKFDSGTINIAQNGNLTISDKYTDDWRFDTENVGTMLFGQQAVFNLNGDLDGNVIGNGKINVLSNDAEIKGNVNLTDGGVMNVGLNNAVIDGNATFNSGSTLKIEIADNGHGSLEANSITGKEGSKLALNITKQMELGQTESFDLLKTDNLSNNFTNEINNNRYDVEFKDGKFNVTYTATAGDVVTENGGTLNNASTADAWSNMTNSTSGNAISQSVAQKLNDLSQNDSKSYVNALTALAPETAPMVQQAQSENANQVFGAVSSRLSGGSISTGGEGMSSGDNIFERSAMWVQGLFNKAKLDDTSKSYGFDADSSGIAMGAEKHINDNTKIGLGYAYTTTDIDGFMRSTDVDTHTAFVYGEYKPNNWYVNGIASYGWSDYEEDKNVAGIGIKSDYDAETFGLQAMTGYDMQIKSFGFTPEAGLRYVHISQDGYTDSADQRVSGNDSDILTGVIGAKISKSLSLENGMIIKPEARIAATYDLVNDGASSVVTLANGSAYSVSGDALDRFGMEFGAGVTAEVNDNVELSLGYEGKFREDYQDHTGLLNAKYNF